MGDTRISPRRRKIYFDPIEDDNNEENNEEENDEIDEKTAKNHEEENNEIEDENNEENANANQINQDNDEIQENHLNPDLAIMIALSLQKMLKLFYIRFHGHTSSTKGVQVISNNLGPNIDRCIFWFIQYYNMK